MSDVPLQPYCEDLAGGCCHRVDPFEYRLRALVSICRSGVSDHHLEDGAERAVT